MRFARSTAVLAAAVLVLTSCGGGDTAAPISPLDAPDSARATALAKTDKARVNWAPGVLEVTVLQGTVQQRSVQLSIDGSVSDASLFITPEIAGFLSIEPTLSGTLPANKTLQLGAIVSASATAPLGTYSGTVHLRSRSSTVPATLKVTVNVVQPALNQVFTEVAQPSPDRIGALPSGQQLVADELAVVLRSDVPNPDARIWEVASHVGALVIGVVPGLPVYQLRFVGADVSSLPALAASVRLLAGVKAVSRQLVVSSLTTPSDSLYSGLWSTDVAADINRHLEFIRAPVAWDKRTSAAGARIGVIDKDFDWAHPDLINNVGNHPSTTKLFLRHDRCNLNGHGTAMAGLICAQGNNGFGVTGVAWQCSMDLYDSSPSFIQVRTAYTIAHNVLDQMKRAVDGSAQVVNISLGLVEANCNSTSTCPLVPSPPSCSADPSPLVKDMNDILREGIEYSIKSDVLWIIAAGNESRSIDFQSPASLVADYPERIIVVSGVEIDTKGVTVGSSVPLWTKSNFSGTRAKVDVAAPATVTSTWPRYYDFLTANTEDAKQSPFTYYSDKYSSYRSEISGTSASAPLVTGVAALVRAQYSGKTAEQVKDCIVRGATAKVIGHDFKVIDAAKAIECAPPPPPTVTLTATPSIVASGGYTRLDWSTTSVNRCVGAGGAFTGSKALTDSEELRDLTTTTKYTLSCDGPSGPKSAEVTVTVTAAPPSEPRIGIVPTSLDFGGQLIGAPSAAKSFSITNTGSAPLIISSVTSEGANAGDFAVATQTCTQAPLAAASGCSVSVVFTPIALGARSALLSIADNAAGTPHNAGLVGTGLTGPPPPPPPPPTIASRIAAGNRHTCAITPSGGVKCWGFNVFGQLGDGTLQDRLAAVDVVGLGSGVTAIAVGENYTCGLASGGAVKCWGTNVNGQLGDGTRTQRWTPVDVIDLGSGVMAIAAGANSAGGVNTCALTSGGGVKCWGYNFYGQLGDGTTADRLMPVDVAGLSSGVGAIAVGGSHSCALTTGGSVKCWGANYYGQLGDGTTTDRLTPVDVADLGSGVGAISLGMNHSCAVSSSGGVKCWGFNNNGQLGDGTTTYRMAPVDVVGLSIGVSAIALSGFHTCALTSSGGVKCWGPNSYGQLGDGTTTASLTPIDVFGLSSGVNAIAAGELHTCGLTAIGGAKCWGAGDRGQLGDGATVVRPTPVNVLGFP